MKFKFYFIHPTSITPFHDRASRAARLIRDPGAHQLVSELAESESPERRAISGGASNAAGGGINLQPRRNVPGGGVPDLQVQAIVREISRLFQPQFDSLHERMEQMEERSQRANTPPIPRREQERPWQHANDLYEASDVESDRAS